MFEFKPKRVHITTNFKFPVLEATAERNVLINGEYIVFMGRGIATYDKNNKFNLKFAERLAKHKAVVDMLNSEIKFLRDLTHSDAWKLKKKKKKKDFELNVSNISLEFKETDYRRVVDINGELFTITPYTGKHLTKGE